MRNHGVSVHHYLEEEEDELTEYNGKSWRGNGEDGKKNRRGRVGDEKVKWKGTRTRGGFLTKGAVNPRVIITNKWIKSLEKKGMINFYTRHKWRATN